MRLFNFNIVTSERMIIKRKAVISANISSNIYTRSKIIYVLQNMGYDVHAVCSFDGYDEKLRSELSVEPHYVKIDTRKKNPFEDIGLFFSYIKLYKTIKPDIVITFTIKPDIYGGIAAGLCRIPVISNVTGLGKAFEKVSILSFVSGFLYKIAFSYKNNFVFFQNIDDKKLFFDKKIIKSEERTGLLPGSGVDIEFFNSDITAAKKIIPTKIEFSFIARLILTKGIREYITAAKKIKEKYPDCLFHVVGNFVENDIDFISKKELDRAVSENIIIYHGFLHDIRTFLAEHTDCLVFPSYYREGVPRILLEGAAMKKPLIAADSIGTREPIVDGRNGFLVIPRNSDDLAEKMTNFLNLSLEQKLRMGEQSRKIAEEYFSDEIVAERYRERIAFFSNIEKKRR